jgi:hypothetical protein
MQLLAAGIPKFILNDHVTYVEPLSPSVVLQGSSSRMRGNPNAVLITVSQRKALKWKKHVCIVPSNLHD